MKTYILIPLAVLSFASVALSQNEPYFLITVLFYNDGKGQIVAAGRIPRKVNQAIIQDFESRLTNTNAKIVVVPIFRQLATAPAASEMTAFVEDTFKDVYLVEIPKWLASKVVYEKRKKMTLRNMKNHKLDNLAVDTQNKDEALDTNSISAGKFYETSHINITKVPKSYYMANTVFYAVETKCIIPTDYSCYIYNQNRHIIAPRNKTFKTIFSTKSRDSQF